MPSSDFTSYLGGYGPGVYTSAPRSMLPTGTRAVANFLPFPGATVERPIYGHGQLRLVPTRELPRTGGLARPGQPITIWYIGFERTVLRPGDVPHGRPSMPTPGT